jgi:hypothetical protein
MPLPRRKESGATAAPILNLLRARIKLVDVEEYETPRQVTRRSDNATFTLDPQFSCTVEVLDDGENGDYNGSRFFESFRYKQDPETGEWILRQYSKLGVLAEIVRPGYFDDEDLESLSEYDLEGFQLLARIKPKKNSAGKAVGSILEWDSLSAVPTRTTSSKAEQEEIEDWEGLPF